MKVSDAAFDTVVTEHFPRVIEGRGFVDRLSFYANPNRNGLHLVVTRAYDQAKKEIGTQVEKLDIAERAPWVRLRAAMRGMQL